MRVSFSMSKWLISWKRSVAWMKNSTRLTTKGALHELNQMVNPRVNHLVKHRHVARDSNPRLKLT